MITEEEIKILGKIECEWCGSNCDLLEIKADFSKFKQIHVICRECLLGEDEDAE